MTAKAASFPAATDLVNTAQDDRWYTDIAATATGCAVRPENAMSATDHAAPMSDPNPSDALHAELESLRAQVAHLTSNVHELISTQTRKQLLLHRATDAIIQFESAGAISSFNGATERVFDYAEIQILHQHWNCLFDLPDAFRNNVPGYLLD